MSPPPWPVTTGWARPTAVTAASRRHELADALREACASALPRPKRPSAFCLVQELPLGPTGKVALHRLRELAPSACVWPADPGGDLGS
jgi:acyl-CoA synthetase (AMP-forming)/AMP-acid ligase II